MQSHVWYCVGLIGFSVLLGITAVTDVDGFGGWRYSRYPFFYDHKVPSQLQ
jgi:hypothetical protein